MTAICGHTTPGFESVAAQFSRNFTHRGDVGAAFAVWHRGQNVIDLWGGTADPDTGTPWRQNTIQVIFSGTKGLIAACVLWLIEHHRLDLDTPLARYWPAFGQADKSAITVADVLSHRSRLSGIQQPFSVTDMYDHDTMAALLAAQSPSRDPRAAFTYHALTFGWLTDELIRRVDGRTAAELFTEQFADPLRLEVWIGLPEHLHHRVATSVATQDALLDIDPATHPDPLIALNANPLTRTDSPRIWNSAAYREAGMTAVGGYATARGMARFYACLAGGGLLDGVRVLSEDTVAAGRRALHSGPNLLGGGHMAYGTGFELAEGDDTQPHHDAFGHRGFGGSHHAAWPGTDLGYSYVMNQIRPVGSPDDRSVSLLEALAKAVADR